MRMILISSEGNIPIRTYDFSLGHTSYGFIASHITILGPGFQT